MTPLLRHIYANARRRAAAEDGVIAILTLGFMMTLGFVLIVTLWSIAYATGAYNELYAGTQAAAYAAVGQTVATNGGNQAQLNFDCGPSLPSALSDGATACVGGGVMGAVDAVFTASFPPGQCGSSFSSGFGISWTTGSNCSTVSLLDANHNPANYVEAFYIPITPGAAQGIFNAAHATSCPYFSSQAGMPVELVCWGSADLIGVVPGVALPHFTSGVIVRTGASVKLPGCSPVFCPVYPLHVNVAAEEGQPNSQSVPAPPPPPSASPPTATIATPANSQTYSVGQSVSTSFSCAEGSGGPGISSCNDSNGGSGNSGTLNTSTAGTFNYVVTATSGDGQNGSASITYTVAAPLSPPIVSSPGPSIIRKSQREFVATHGTWAGGAVSGYTYQWKVCMNPDNYSCEFASGETNSPYFQDYKSGGPWRWVEVIVRASNASGSATEISSPHQAGGF